MKNGGYGMHQHIPTLASFLNDAINAGVAHSSGYDDPINALTAAGVRITGADVKQWLGLANASDAELIEVLRGRIVRAALNDGDSGCGCSCIYPDVGADPDARTTDGKLAGA